MLLICHAVILAHCRGASGRGAVGGTAGGGGHGAEGCTAEGDSASVEWAWCSEWHCRGVGWGGHVAKGERKN